MDSEQEPFFRVPTKVVCVAHATDKEFPPLNLNDVADGSYDGALSHTRWAVSVRVTVDEHRIENIEITDRKGSNITQSLVNELHANLLHTGEPKFDAVSGATMTTKGYLIAVADALDL